VRFIITLFLVAACGAAPPAIGVAPEALAPKLEASKRAHSLFETPCFRERRVLIAEQMYRDLEAYATMFGEAPTANGRYGSCAVGGGVVTDRGGNQVAELHCGIRVMGGAIVDHLGLEIGARASDVVEGYARAEQRLVCTQNGEQRTRCWFNDPDDSEQHEPRAHYVVDGQLPEPAVSGAPAIAFLADKHVVEFTMRMWCH